MTKLTKPPFTRVGGKTRLSKLILSKIPPHKTYVEPFVGGGAIFIKKEPSEKEVINDKDSGLMKAWKILKKPTNQDLTVYDSDNLTTLNKWYKSSATDGIPILVKEIVKSKNTFGGRGSGKLYGGNNQHGNTNKGISPYIVLRHKQEYEERLKNTTILNQDYKSVVKKYDSPTTFFYLDPPYESSEDLYTHGSFNFEELASVLRGVRGMFLLSLNDSPRIRSLFKGFKIRGVVIKSATSFMNRGTGDFERKEVFISNY